jgi:hypothetical protein
VRESACVCVHVGMRGRTGEEESKGDSLVFYFYFALSPPPPPPPMPPPGSAPDFLTSTCAPGRRGRGWTKRSPRRSGRT